MSKTILVTGGAGFIGSHFIRHMLSKYPEYNIINLDKLTYAGNPNNLKDIKKKFSLKRYSFIRGDICNKKTVNTICKRGVDYIVNFAAETHVDRSIVRSEDFLQTNVFGTRILLEAARENKIKLFIQIGTDEVYGSRDFGFFKEGDSLVPSSPYAASKAAADLLSLSFFTTFKLPVIITRSGNNFGPNQFPEKVIPLFVTNLLENKKVPLYGDGLNVRDWIFVLDNIEAIDLIMHKGNIGEIYNIGAGNLVANLELTKTILSLMGKDGSFVESVSDRPGHDRRYALDFSKVRNLGWYPLKSFQDALNITIDWYSKNTDWWKPLKDEKNSYHWLKRATR